MNFDFVLKANGLLEIAVGMYTGPAIALAVTLGMNGKPQRAEKGVFGVFHVAKKVGEVDNPCHIGMGEIHAMYHSKFAGHLVFVHASREILLSILPHAPNSGDRKEQ